MVGRIFFIATFVIIFLGRYLYLILIIWKCPNKSIWCHVSLLYLWVLFIPVFSEIQS